MYDIISKKLKIISIKNFKKINAFETLLVKKSIERNYKKYPPDNQLGFNFPIKETTHFFRDLYQDFAKSSYKIFGGFNLKSNNSSSCWCYRSNKKSYASVFHHHSSSATINGVYYLKANKGSISFLKNSEYLTYFPEDYELLIFPGTLTHKPDPPSSKKIRYSINMEILTEESSLFLFDQINELRN